MRVSQTEGAVLPSGTKLDISSSEGNDVSWIGSQRCLRYKDLKLMPGAR